MKVDRRQFADAVGLAKKVTRQEPTNPTISCVQISADGDTSTAYVQATNLDVTVRSPLSCTGDMKTALVPVSRVFGAVKAMKDDTIELTATDDRLNIFGASSTVTVPTVEDTLPEFSAEPCQEWYDGDLFFDAIGRVSHAASDNLEKSTMRAIHIASADGKTIVEACDGYRMARQIIGDSMSIADALVPAEALNLVRDASHAGDKLGWLIQEDGNAHFWVPAAEVTTRCVMGQYPQLSRLIRTEHTIEVLVETQEMQNAVRVAKACMSDTDKALRLELTPSSLLLSASEEDGDFCHEVPVQINGPTDFAGGITLPFLADAINAFQGENISIGLADPLKQAVFTDPQDADFVSVVMLRALL